MHGTDTAMQLDTGAGCLLLLLLYAVSVKEEERNSLSDDGSSMK